MSRPVKTSGKNTSCKVQPTADTVKRAQELLNVETKTIKSVLAKPALKLEHTTTDYLLNWDKNELIRLVNKHFEYHKEIVEAYDLRLIDYLERTNKQKEIDFDCCFIKEGQLIT